jgi:hypothetical protein
MGLRLLASLLILTATLRAQEVSELVEALARSAATFALTAPGLGADETLDQRGRRGFIEVLNGKVPTARNSDLRLPEEFQQHHVVSKYALNEDSSGLHESRSAVAMDGIDAEDSRAIRHAMSMGVSDPRRQSLEDFEHETLEGAVTDFGQLLLLFTARHLNDYDFSLAEPDKPVLTYRQKSGNQGVTLFAQRTAERQPIEGQIWFSGDDLVPARITLKTRKVLSKNFAVETEASVEYTPSRFGLVPASVTHRQFLNTSLLVENDLHYANYRHTGPELIP